MQLIRAIRNHLPLFFILIAAGLVLSVGIRHHRTMQSALAQLQAQNQADTVFRSDSSALRLVNYFSWFGTPNEQLLAHYLLGRAYADMGEAPQSIEAYHNAVDCADTTASHCDFQLLRNVYGQMAEVFHTQNLPEDELKAQKQFIHYSWLIGDTIMAIDGYRMLENVYWLLQKEDSILYVDSCARQQLLKYGDREKAARALITPFFIHVQRKEYQTAQKDLSIIRSESNLFDSSGRLMPGREMLYYTIGNFFEGQDQLDSAEYYYRLVLDAKEYEAAYKGLLSVYGTRKNNDSIVKYARLYADANDKMHREMNSSMVHHTSALYNYNRHLQQKQHYFALANKRLTWLAICIILLIIISLNHARTMSKKWKQEQALEQMRHLYMVRDDELRAAQEKLSTQTTDNKALSKRVEELQAEKAHISNILEHTKQRKDVASYYASRAVHEIIHGTLFRDKAPTNKVLNKLYDAFVSAFPHFTNYVAETHQLTEMEWDVCILTDLGLSNNDIAHLLQLSPQRVNGLKVQVNHNLFSANDASSLRGNLFKIIHLQNGVDS